MAKADYIFKGRLCGYICPECPEPLSNVKVRLYRHADDQPISALAAASPKDTFAILSDKQVKAKQSLLIAEVDTDAQGAFQFELGAKQNYDGGAFEIDVYCGTVPHHTPKKPEPLQFSITTLHPQWRETEQGRVAAFDYCIPQRNWCGVRAKFGAWTICGQVTVCKTKEPVAGVKVIAFDRDWLQDDPLGSGLTDGAGKFRIDYAAHDFKKTPWVGLDIEWFGGPDLYFRVETPGGTPLLVEPPSKGRTPGRENVGPCFCVDLCLDQKQPPTHPGPIPLFTNVGAYDVDPAAGDFTADGTTTAGHMAFTGSIPLIGILPNGDAPDAEQYRFQIATFPGPGAPQDVVAAWIKPTAIGRLEYYAYFGGAWHLKQTPYWVNNPGASVSISQDGAPDLVVSLNKDVGPNGWIDVPRENELFFGGRGLFTHESLLVVLDTTQLSNQVFDVTVPPPPLKAGESVPGPKKAAKPTYRILFEARKAPPSLAAVGSNQLDKIAISNTTYTFIRHPEWAGGPVSAHSVVSLDIAEMIAPGATGCDQLDAHLHALYTAYNPYLGAVEVYFEGNPPLPAAINPAIAGGEAASGAAGHDFDISALNPCAYILWLSATAQLTSGYGLIGGATITDHIAFCKS
jgi:hypothetical protein